MEQQLYELPKGWEYRPIEDVASLVSGQHLRKDEYTETRSRDSIPYLTGPAEFGEFCPEPKRWTSERRSIAVSGDTLITVKGSGVGKVNKMVAPEIAISRQLMAVRPGSLLDSNFLYLFLQAIQDVFSAKKTGAAIPGIGRRDVLEQYIPLPPLNEQKRIVAKLDALFTRIDTAITHLQDTLKLSKALFASALDEALVPGGDRNRLPKGWKWKELGDICTLENGDRGKNYPSRSAFVDKGIPVINAGNLTGEGIDFASLNYITRERFDLISNGKVREGDVLFCLRGTLGKVGLAAGIDEGVIASSLVIIRAGDGLAIRFLLAYLNSHFCAEMIDKYDNGAAQPNLSAKNLKKFLIPLPPFEEQELVATYLDALADHTRTLEAETRERLEQLTALKSSLLDTAFRGQLSAHNLKEVADAG